MTQQQMDAAIEAAGEKVPKKWKNIQSIHIKTPQSVALPIYDKPIEDGSIYNGPALPGIIDAAAAAEATEAVKKDTKRTKKRKADEKPDSAPATENKKSKTAKRKKK